MTRLAAAATMRKAALDVFVRRLSSLAPLSREAGDFIAATEARPQNHPAGFYIQHEHEDAASPKILLSGWACRQHYLSDGRRQIFAFLLPGDSIALGDGMRRTAQTDIVALTPISICDAKDVDAGIDGCEGLAPAIERVARLHDVFLFNQIVRIGRQTAYERMAHLLLELQYRLAAVGLADDLTMPLPLTQDVLADALGLSTVHVNRTLKQFRSEELVEIRSGKARFIDIEALRLVSDFQIPKLD